MIKLREQYAAVVKENVELKALLRSIEFVYDPELKNYYCPKCGAREDMGHNTSCELSKMLNKERR